MLTRALKLAGVQAAFSGGANFSRLSSTPLVVSDVVHTVGGGGGGGGIPPP